MYLSLQRQLWKIEELHGREGKRRSLGTWGRTSTSFWPASSTCSRTTQPCGTEVHEPRGSKASHNICGWQASTGTVDGTVSQASVIIYSHRHGLRACYHLIGFWAQWMPWLEEASFTENVLLEGEGRPGLWQLGELSETSLHDPEVTQPAISRGEPHPHTCPSKKLDPTSSGPWFLEGPPHPVLASSTE